MLIHKLIYRSLRRTIRNIIGYPVIYNANRVDEQQYDKRALLVYLVKPFILDPDDPKLLHHQNMKRCRQIASALDEFGYVVDVADVNDRRFRAKRDYDLIISHRVDLMVPSTPRRIYFSSGMNHFHYNQNIRKRYEALEERRHCKLKVRRLNTEQMPYVLDADAIMGVGNEHTIGTWREIFSGPIYGLNSYGFAGTVFDNMDKDYDSSRKHFLFFASGPQVNKGLDLLLEIFPKYKDIHLYVCSRFEYERDFSKCYEKELYETPNVHPIGWTFPHSDIFHEISRKCAFVIVPTCSEGSIGSVIQGMHAGLIPIVTREAGIDTDDFGITLDDDSISTIESTILELSSWPVAEIEEHRIRTLAAAKNNFSESAFEKKIRQIFSTVLA